MAHRWKLTPKNNVGHRFNGKNRMTFSPERYWITVKRLEISETDEFHLKIELISKNENKVLGSWTLKRQAIFFRNLIGFIQKSMIFFVIPVAGQFVRVHLKEIATTELEAKKELATKEIAVKGIQINKIIR